MRRSKVVLLVLGLFMVFAVTIGAQGNREGQAGESSTQSTGTMAQEVVKPEAIKLMVDGTFQVRENGEQVLESTFEELTGIDLVLNHPIHNEYYTRVNLAFATGDVPDVLLLGGNNYVKYAQAGQLLDLTEFYEASAFRSRVSDPGVIEALKIDGKLYGIPFERGNGTITYVRGDWLDKLGLSAPTNYAEFLNMLRLFKNQNPDGLSPEDVIPITSAGIMNSEYPLDIYLREFYQDSTPDFVEVGGQWVDGMLQSNMRPALERMRVAYSEGLIDREIFTNKTSTARDKWNSGRVGVFNYWAGSWNLNLHNSITPNIPHAKVTPIPAIAEATYVERPATVYAITTRAQNPEGIFQYFHEFVLDGGVGQTWATFGREGVFHEVVGGQRRWLPSLQDPNKLFSKAVISAELPVVQWNSGFRPDQKISDSLAMFQANSEAYGLIPYSEESSELVGDLNQIRNKWVTRVVIGEVTVDAGLSGYAQEANALAQAILGDLNN